MVQSHELQAAQEPVVPHLLPGRVVVAAAAAVADGGLGVLRAGEVHDDEDGLDLGVADLLEVAAVDGVDGLERREGRLEEGDEGRARLEVVLQRLVLALERRRHDPPVRVRVEERRLGERHRVEQLLPDLGVDRPAVAVLLAADEVGHFGRDLGSHCVCVCVCVCVRARVCVKISVFGLAQPLSLWMDVNVEGQSWCGD